MLQKAVEKIKLLYRSTPFSWLDAIPRIILNDAMAYPIFEKWDSASNPLQDDEVRYLAIGASDVVATGSWPQSYATTIKDVLAASGSVVKFRNYNCSIWGSYTRQINSRLRYLKATNPSARFDFCTIMTGYNDGIWNIPPDEFETDLESLLVSALQVCEYVYLLDAKDLKRMPPIFGLPALIEKYISNDKMWRYADRYYIRMKRVVERIDNPRLHVVPIRKEWLYNGEKDFTFDGIHPNIAGYNKIARAILRQIEKNGELMSKLNIEEVIK